MTPTETAVARIKKEELNLIHDAMVMLGAIRIGQAANPETLELAQRVLKLRPTDDPWTLARYLSDFFHVKMTPTNEPTETLVESSALPRYRCHKEVHALKIANIEVCSPEWANGGTVVLITPEEKDYPKFAVSWDYVNKHKPEVGMYWVLYEDGYQSASPAEAFESGYSLIDPPA